MLFTNHLYFTIFVFPLYSEIMNRPFFLEINKSLNVQNVGECREGPGVGLIRSYTSTNNLEFISGNPHSDLQLTYVSSAMIIADRTKKKFPQKQFSIRNVALLGAILFFANFDLILIGYKPTVWPNEISQQIWSRSVQPCFTIFGYKQKDETFKCRYVEIKDFLNIIKRIKYKRQNYIRTRFHSQFF